MQFAKPILIFMLVVLAASLVNQNLAQKSVDSGMDIYYSWLEGGRLLQGENPYARILAGNMQENDKYATYFPLFYLLSWASQRAGFVGLEAWLGFWRGVFLGFDLAIAGLIYYHHARRDLLALAAAGALFWLLNRWTLYQVRVAYFDFIPLFFMILGLMLFPRWRVAALLAMSVSLAFKQMAIFLLPLYLIWIWQNSSGRPWRDVLTAALWLGLVPLLTSLPFLVWNAEGFVRSVLFSATRDAADQFSTPVLAVRLNWSGLSARLPMLGMMSLIYWAAWRRQVKKYMAAFLVMLMFVEFNPVQFRQYFAWIMVFVPFLINDVTAQETNL